MEVKELRIGNYINIIADGHEHEPDTFQWSIDDYEYYETVMFNIIPIPLTEEWLLKFGFEYNSYPDSLTLNVLSFGRFNAYSISKDLTIELSTQSGYMFGTTKIKYVHELQNLYFALTGEELTIK